MSVFILCSEESPSLRAHATALGARLIKLPKRTLLRLMEDVAHPDALHPIQTTSDSDELRHALSKREEELVAELAKGSAYKEIARHLGISVRTVESHIRNITHKSEI